MSFTSVLFVLVFLPLFAVAQGFVRPARRFGLTLVASVLFLAAGQWTALPWLLGLALAGYAVGRRIAARLASGRKATGWLWLGIGLNLGLLLAFKLLATYRPGPVDIGGLPLAGIALPLGLSYFTFQVIAYLVDVAAADIPAEQNVLRFISYVLFFPKVAAGPITKYQAFAGQIGSLRPSAKDAVAGFGRILVGEAKSVCIARPLGVFAGEAFSRAHANLEPAVAWLVLVAGLLQLYFEFSGYTDIAIGLGRLIGIRLPENFNYPFISQSIGEYWRRWHITLIAWLREYVFFPLERHRLRWAGQPLNLLIVFLAAGLWHGPTPNFLLWGLLQGLAIAFESTAAGKAWLQMAWRPVRHLYVILVILLSGVFFRSASLAYADEFFRRLAGSRAGLDSAAAQAAPLALDPSLFVVLLVALVFSLPVKNRFLAWMEKLGAEHLPAVVASRNPVVAAMRTAAAALWEGKRWWLASMAIVLAIFGLMFALAETVAPARFTYAGF